MASTFKDGNMKLFQVIYTNTNISNHDNIDMIIISNSINMNLYVGTAVKLQNFHASNLLCFIHFELLWHIFANVNVFWKDPHMNRIFWHVFVQWLVAGNVKSIKIYIAQRWIILQYLYSLVVMIRQDNGTIDTKAYICFTEMARLRTPTAFSNLYICLCNDVVDSFVKCSNVYTFK